MFIFQVEIKEEKNYHIFHPHSSIIHSRIFELQIMRLVRFKFYESTQKDKDFGENSFKQKRRSNSIWLEMKTTSSTTRSNLPMVSLGR